MASETVDYTHNDAMESREKDAIDGEKLDDAGGIHTPSSTDGLTPKERAALTRRLLLKLDLRYVEINYQKY